MQSYVFFSKKTTFIYPTFTLTYTNPPPNCRLVALNVYISTNKCDIFTKKDGRTIHLFYIQYTNELYKNRPINRRKTDLHITEKDHISNRGECYNTKVC